MKTLILIILSASVSQCAFADLIGPEESRQREYLDEKFRALHSHLRHVENRFSQSSNQDAGDQVWLSEAVRKLIAMLYRADKIISENRFPDTNDREVNIQIFKLMAERLKIELKNIAAEDEFDSITSELKNLDLLKE